jgi:hypothetical protein
MARLQKIAIAEDVRDRVIANTDLSAWSGEDGYEPAKNSGNPDRRDSSA